ncbi:MAG: protein kinase [Gemmatimonadaceae bacterium]
MKKHGRHKRSVAAQRAVTVDGEPAALAALAEEYEILRELGRGGTAFVFLARERATGKEVAIKLMRAKYAEDEESLARFAREAKYVESLDHPNVVPVHAVRDLGEHGLAIVMGHVAGRTLKHAIYEEGPLSPDRAERVMRDVATALTAVHALGIVHRDVKPENIFLGDDGRALLADFGVARSVYGDSQLTLAGIAIGTPTYMAPEQIDGAGLDQRGDLYSLGLVAWEALAGRRPWDGQSLYSVIYSQKHEWLPDVRELRDDVPDRLADAIAGCLEKDRDARWASAGAVIEALDGNAGARTRRAHAAAMDTMAFPRAIAARVDDSSSNAIAAVGATGDDAVDDFFAKREWRRRIAMAAMTLVVAGVIASMAAVLSANHGGAAEPRRVAAVVPARSAATPTSNTRATPPGAGTVRAADSVGTRASDVVRPTDPVRADASGAIAFEAAGPRPAARPIAHPTSPPATEPRSVVAQRPVATGAASSIAARAPARSTAPAPNDSPAPRLALRLPPMTIATGGLHSCMLVTDGRAFCWGANDRGQLGTADTARAAPAPVAIGGDLRFTALSAGLSHSCALARGGAAYCWGDNRHGQLGDRSTVAHDAPARAAEGLSFRSITSGATHTCALDADGTAWCWGANAHGQLGGGTGLDRPVPAEVRTAEHFASIEAGWNFTCALDVSKHAACWGDNSAGQLGDETTTDRRTPAPVVGALAFVSLSAGNTHACGVTRAGEAYCWGGNSNGQLGDGSTGERHTPVRVASFERFVSISAGATHTCAIAASGEAFCWGRNSYGQLGDGGTSEHATPTRVAGGHAFVTLHAFASHSCGATPAGQLLCWGLNLDGQLGDGTRTQRAQPVMVDRTAEH